MEHVAAPEEPVVAPVDLGSSPVLQRLKRSFLSPGALIGLVLGLFSYTSEKENTRLQEQNQVAYPHTALYISFWNSTFQCQGPFQEA